MAQTLTFTIKFNVDPPDVQQALDAVKGSLKDVGVSITNVAEGSSKVNNALDDNFTKLGLRMQGMKNLFDIVSGSLGQFIRTSNEGELASAKLEQALENQGIYTESLVDDLKAFAAARQEATGIDDDATVAIMGQLTAMGLQGESLRDAIVAVQDLSTLMDGDMHGAVRVVADAFSGNAEMLKRYIKGLDETDIKHRGTISIIEQLQRAVGGQAEAMGNKDAGKIQKFNAAVDDMRQSFGDLLKNAIGPALQPLTETVRTITSLPPSFQAAALGALSLGTAWALLNGQMTATHVIVGGSLTLLLVLWNAMRSGDVIATALTASLGAVGLALLLLRDRFFIAALGAGEFRVAMQALTASLAANPILVAVLAIAAAGATLYAFAQRAEAANQELRKTAADAEAAANGLSDFDKTINDFSTNQIVIKLRGLRSEVAQLEAEIQKVDQSRGWFDMFWSDSDADKRVAELQGKLDAALALIEKMNSAYERRSGVTKKTTAEETAFDLELRQLRVDAMEEGYAKERAQILLTFDTEKQKASERKDLSDAERNRLIAGYAVVREAKLKALGAEPVRDVLIVPIQPTISDPTKFKKDLAEAIASTNALPPVIKPTDAGSINAQNRIVEQLRVKLNAALSDEDRKRIARELQMEQDKLDRMTLSNREYLNLKRQMWAEEHEIAMAGMQAIGAGVNSLWRSITSERENIDVDGMRRRDRLASIDEEKQRQLLRQQLAEGRVTHEEYQLRLEEISAAGAQRRTEIERAQAKQNETIFDKAWSAMKDAALNAIGTILQRQLEAYLIDVAAHTTAETTKTATTEGNAIARVASAVWEGISKAATWAWETATFIAKEVAMTVAFLAQQAIRVAAAAIEVAVTIAKAVANFIVSLGPLGLILAPAAIAAGIGVVAGIKKAFGFERGGQFEKDQRGFIEGGQTEIIAPRRTFDEIMRTEIVPMLVRTTQMVTLQYRQPSLAGSGGSFALSELTALRKEVSYMRDEARRKKLNVYVGNVVGERELVERNLAEASRRNLERTR